MKQTRARFSIGQLVQHKLFNYRGAIIDVDAVFQGTEAWYEKMALNNPPKDKPWYHLLVDGAVHHAYVAEDNLQLDVSNEPINHPELDNYFSDFKKGAYLPVQTRN